MSINYRNLYQEETLHSNQFGSFNLNNTFSLRVKMVNSVKTKLGYLGNPGLHSQTILGLLHKHSSIKSRYHLNA